MTKLIKTFYRVFSREYLIWFRPKYVKKQIGGQERDVADRPPPPAAAIAVCQNVKANQDSDND